MLLMVIFATWSIFGHFDWSFLPNELLIAVVTILKTSEWGTTALVIKYLLSAVKVGEV